MLGHQKWSSSLVEQDCSWQEREEGVWPQTKVKTSTLAVPTVLKNIYLFHFLLTSRHPLFWFVVYFLLHLGCLETLPGDHFRSAMLFQTSTYSKQFPVEYISHWFYLCSAFRLCFLWVSRWTLKLGMLSPVTHPVSVRLSPCPLLMTRRWCSSYSSMMKLSSRCCHSDCILSMGGCCIICKNCVFEDNTWWKYISEKAD